MTKFTKSVIAVNAVNLAFLLSFSANAFFSPTIPNIVPAITAKTKTAPAKAPESVGNAVKSSVVAVDEIVLSDGTVCVNAVIGKSSILMCNSK